MPTLALKISNKLKRKVGGVNILSIYFGEINKYPLLNLKEERELGRLVLEKNDLNARNKLVSHNLRLVIPMARQYACEVVDFRDLLQEGNDGLITAADKFDYRKGIKFSTYATGWIYQRIIRYLFDKSRTIRLPVNLVLMINKYIKIVQILARKLKREPFPEEIATEIEELEKRMPRILSAMSMTVDSLNEAVVRSSSSMEEGSELEELIADKNVISADTYAIASQEIDLAWDRLFSFLKKLKVLKEPENLFFRNEIVKYLKLFLVLMIPDSAVLCGMLGRNSNYLTRG